MTSKLSGGLALSAALGLGVASIAGAAAVRTVHPKRGAAFVGVTSQKGDSLALPVDMRVSPNGQVMARFDIQWGAVCRGPGGEGTFGGLQVSQNKKIFPPGSFGDSTAFTKTYANGDTGFYKTKLFGRFTSPVRATGTFQLTLDVISSAGATTETCDSGVVTWSATN
jgi:hypothetical protein